MPPTRSWDVEEFGLRPEYHTISCELKALAKMVQQELGTVRNSSFDDNEGILGGPRSPLFERGRFYDEYTARRNERLRRKKGEVVGYEKKPAYDLGVRVESAKKRESANKFDSRRKAVAAAAATPVTERRMPPPQTPRYSLRSTSKENKKPPIPMASAMSLEKSVGITERKVRRTRKV